MKNFLKTTKWWMYLPFACVYGQSFVHWVTIGETYEDRFHRIVFLFINMFYSVILLSITCAHFLFKFF